MHNVLIKDFNKLITKKSKHYGKKYVLIFFTMLSSSRVSDEHIKCCLVIYNIKSVSLPEGNIYNKSQNFKRLIKGSIKMYGDLDGMMTDSKYRGRII